MTEPDEPVESDQSTEVTATFTVLGPAMTDEDGVRRAPPPPPPSQRIPISPS